MQNDKLNSEKINELIKQAAKASGVGENEIKNAAESGDFKKVLSNLSPEGAKSLKKILSDKRATKELLSTPQARQLLLKILGDGKNG